MPSKGRKVPPLQPGERKLYDPGQLRDSLDPVLRQNIEQLALVGYERDGRGALLVELDDTTRHGIRRAEYLSVGEVEKLVRGVPSGSAQPISEVVAQYDPEREFVAVVVDTTPGLPAPQLWFDIFQRIM
jgi:hypothetical protein